LCQRGFGLKNWAARFFLVQNTKAGWKIYPGAIKLLNYIP
jgi:hypothetical protein